MLDGEAEQLAFVGGGQPGGGDRDGTMLWSEIIFSHHARRRILPRRSGWGSTRGVGGDHLGGCQRARSTCVAARQNTPSHPRIALKTEESHPGRRESGGPASTSSRSSSSRSASAERSLAIVSIGLGQLVERGLVDARRTARASRAGTSPPRCVARKHAVPDAVSQFKRKTAA